MAIYSATYRDYLLRAGDYLDPTQDWTYRFNFYWVTATPSAEGSYRNLLILGDPSYTAPWLALYHSNAPTTFGIGLSADPGTGVVFTAGGTATTQLWHVGYLAYERATHTLTFEVNASIVATLSLDLDACPPFPLELLGSDTTPFTSDQRFAYVRVWQRLLTTPEKTAENASPTAVLTTNLLADTPLTSIHDTIDLSGNRHHWSAVGALETVRTRSYYELCEGWWGRISAGRSVALSPAGYLHQLLINNGVVIVRITLAGFHYAGGTPPESDFTVTTAYLNGMTAAYITNTLTNPFIDPVINDYATDFSYRESDPGLAWSLKVRTSTFDAALNALMADGALTLYLANVAVLTLTDLTFGDRHDHADTIGLRHQMEGDFDRPWVMKGLTMPTMDANGVLSSTVGLLYQEDFTDGDTSAWTAWAGFGANTMPFTLPVCGAARGWGVSSFSESPAIFGSGSFLAYAGLQRDLTFPACIAPGPDAENPCGDIPTDLEDPCGITQPVVWGEVRTAAVLDYHAPNTVGAHRIHGCALPYNELSAPDFHQRQQFTFAPGSFTEAIRRNDARLFLEEHESELASCRDGTLKFWETDRGLMFEALLQGGMAPYALQFIAGGLVKGVCCETVGTHVKRGNRVVKVDRFDLGLLLIREPSFPSSFVKVRHAG